MEVIDLKNDSAVCDSGQSWGAITLSKFVITLLTSQTGKIIWRFSGCFLISGAVKNRVYKTKLKLGLLGFGHYLPEKLYLQIAPLRTLDQITTLTCL